MGLYIRKNRWGMRWKWSRECIRNMRHVYSLLLGCLFAVSVCAQQPNDHIFPAAAAARPFISFDSKGFFVDGKRTFLVSAGMEYARVPRALWADRLLRLQRCGFNCVEVYTFWNIHEPREGVFDFKGENDLDAFLKLVKKMGMYAIVRVGPYYCAEWDNGGYPLWLKFKPGLRVREPNFLFEKYVGLFFDRLLPIVSANQIHRGGAVIMVQLENEHPAGWGTDEPNSYFSFLRKKALTLGLEVPYFFSGLHHDNDPAGETLSLRDPARPNPWFSTEFWSVWYNGYGSGDSAARVFGRRTWKIIARGGGGYNYYMAHGGSNFGYTNNDEDAASYDYGAAVGQAGDLRPIYFGFKRAAIFAHSFQDILENSINAASVYKDLTTDSTLKITARSADAGDLIFLDNPGKKNLTAIIKVGGGIPASNITLAPGEIYPLVHNYTINNLMTLNWSLSRIYGLVRQGNTTTILVEAKKGEQTALYFQTSGKPVLSKGNAAFKLTDGNLSLITFSKQSLGPDEFTFEVSGQRVRILVMDVKGMNKTWLTEQPGFSAIISGPSYLDKVQMHNKQLLMNAEHPLKSKNDGPVWLYMENSSTLLKSVNQLDINTNSTINLAPWRKKNASVYAEQGYNDQDWFSSTDPQQMGADGNLTANAWYCTKLDVPTSGKYTMQVDGGDRATAFVDGKKTIDWKVRDGEVTFKLEKGPHILSIFTAHDGRDKLAAYMGPITDVD